MKNRNSATKPDLSMTRAARILGVDSGTLENWRTEGCPGLPPARFSRAAVVKWAAEKGKHAAGLGDREGMRAKKLAEEVRKLKLANDARAELVVERAKVADCIRRMSADWNSYRVRAESTLPLRFAASANDVPACREILRGIFDEATLGLQSLARHFDE
jgi:hypothetical protein